MDLFLSMEMLSVQWKYSRNTLEIKLPVLPLTCRKNIKAVKQYYLQTTYRPPTDHLPTTFLQCSLYLYIICAFSCSRVRLYVNVPGSLIVAGNSNKPIRRPPSSTKIEPPAVEPKNTKVTVEGEGEGGGERRVRGLKLTESGAVSL